MNFIMKDSIINIPQINKNLVLYTFIEFMVRQLLALCLILMGCLSISLNHKRWSTSNKDLAKITDINWNYCDLKCIYLENYLDGADFVVLNFVEIGSNSKFADCYVATNSSYDHWSVKINNSMYSRICGGDP